MTYSLLVGIFVSSDPVSRLLRQGLSDPNYTLHWETAPDDFLDWVNHNFHRIDCLILQHSPAVDRMLDQLRTQELVLPAIVITAAASAPEEILQESVATASAVDHAEATAAEPGKSNALPAWAACPQSVKNYHAAVLCLSEGTLKEVERSVHQAIHQFLKLPSGGSDTASSRKSAQESQRLVLSLQQQRLTEKLKERLGYLGVYYKRNPDIFFRNMSQAERDELLQKLRTDYRTIILKYFSKDVDLNQRIDEFVNTAFFADISVSRIVEIHMELMDEFAKQLKLEGRSEEILLDYRLTLIDVIAHLCEMYRRSIPREP